MDGPSVHCRFPPHPERRGDGTVRLDFQLLLGSRPGPTGEKQSGVGWAVPWAFSHYPLVQPRVQMGRKGNTSSPVAARELPSSGGVWELSHHRPGRCAITTIRKEWPLKM